jgi:NADH dehydrogenase [ubiquinone] 1 alpha subcomplex assembly factor 1
MEVTAVRRLLVDFSSPQALTAWAVVNDVVMGGVSRSHLEPCAGGAAFTGVVSLDRGGGFASARTRPDSWSTAGARAFVLRARGDGKRYKLTVRTDDGFDGVQYQTGFTAHRDEWEDVTLPVEAFVPTFRGRRVPGAPPLDPARIRAFGLLISDGQAGPFRLELATLSAD